MKLLNDFILLLLNYSIMISVIFNCYETWWKFLDFLISTSIYLHICMCMCFAQLDAIDRI